VDLEVITHALKRKYLADELHMVVILRFGTLWMISKDEGMV
jgi:hypothetical protein